jgi:hypothetical protein
MISTGSLIIPAQQSNVLSAYCYQNGKGSFDHRMVFRFLILVLKYWHCTAFLLLPHDDIEPIRTQLPLGTFLCLVILFISNNFFYAKLSVIIFQYGSTGCSVDFTEGGKCTWFSLIYHSTSPPPSLRSVTSSPRYVTFHIWNGSYKLWCVLIHTWCLSSPTSSMEFFMTMLLQI